LCPQLARHEDRRAGAAAQARRVGSPRRPRREAIGAIAPGAGHRHGAVGLEALDLHQRAARDVGDLAGHGGEHVRRLRTAGDERGQPSQRRLLPAGHIGGRLSHACASLAS
jgi:hypothetical protein